MRGALAEYMAREDFIGVAEIKEFDRLTGNRAVLGCEMFSGMASNMAKIYIMQGLGHGESRLYLFDFEIKELHKEQSIVRTLRKGGFAMVIRTNLPSYLSSLQGLVNQGYNLYATFHL